MEGARWIPLTQGKFALIDADMFEQLSAFAWQYSKASDVRPAYATTRIYTDGRRSNRAVSMHRMVMGEPEGEVDHLNMNGLDNRRANLRVATKSQQRANQFKQANTQSKYKGVCRKRKFWQASIKTARVKHNLGVHRTEEAAARAYDVKARELWGEFARLNFPEPGEQSALNPDHYVSQSDRQLRRRIPER